MKQLNNAELNELVQLIDFTFTLIDALTQAKQNDGKIDLRDFPLLFPVIMTASPAFDNISVIPNAWMNSSQEDRDAIVAYFKTRFDLPNDEIEVKIEKLAAAAVSISDVFLNLK